MPVGLKGRSSNLAELTPHARIIARLRDPRAFDGFAVGVVQLPGMMMGQILAGASPLTAIRYQIVVVFMLAVATAVGSLLFVRLAVGRYPTLAHQLRRYLL